MEASIKNRVQAVLLLLRRKRNQDDMRERIKEATKALKEKTASRVASLEHQIEHTLDNNATIVKGTVTQRRPLYRH